MPAAPEGKPLLARLMSNPAAHTLEHIEKQQRSTTPQPGVQSHSQPQAPAAVVTNNQTGSTANRSKRRNRAATSQPESAAAREQQTSANANSTETNSTSGFLRIQSPTNTALSNQQQVVNSSANPLASLFAQVSGQTVS